MSAFDGDDVRRCFGRKILRTRVGLCAIAFVIAGMTLTSVPALAAAPETPEAEEVTEATATTAKLKGIVNPGNKGEPGHYAFVYTDSASECKGVLQQEFEGVSSGERQEVAVIVANLLPRTTYTFCLVVRDASSLEAISSPVTFTTGSAAAPTVHAETVAAVDRSTATLSALIDPGGLSSDYHVEYLTEAQFDAHEWAEATRAPASNRVLPAGSVDTPVREELSGLQPDTAYRFRFGATNSLGSTQGADILFRTTAAGSSASTLPDHRAYELVSAGNNPADVYVPESGPLAHLAADIITDYPFRAAANGEALAYVGFPGNSGGNGLTGNGVGNEFLARRNPALGWEANDITPEVAVGGQEESSTTYEFFSPDLSTGVLGALSFSSSTFAAAASPEGPLECSSLYSRTDTGFHALFSKAPAPYACGSLSTFGQASEQDLLTVGASADNSQLLFQTPAALVPETKAVQENNGHEGNNLYDSVGGKLSLVNVLSDGSTPAAVYGGPPGNEGQPGLPGDFSGVVSHDGSKIFWTDLSTHRIYMRQNAAKAQSPIVAGHCAAPEDACTVELSAGAAQYWTATPDGRYVYYTENGKLWRFDTTHGARELLVGKGVSGENANVRGVIGAGDDGAYVYLVADGALSAEPNDRGEVATPRACEAVGGEESQGHLPPGVGCNLYVLHVGQAPTYIAALAAKDDHLESAGGTVGDWLPNLGHRTAEVTPNGLHLVFESTQQLTGYDNTILDEELFGGQGGLEVFTYAAQPTAGPGRLFCASCNPSGASPTKELPEGEQARQKAFSEGRGDGGTRFSVSLHPTFMPRWISSDGGRVFFDSSQPLVPQDKNGIRDVYEWEREGVGTCMPATPPRPNGGCVFLLSGGDSADYSYFLDADATGENVFFTHRGRLGQMGPDDEKAEAFDARVNGGFPQISLACTGAGCQGVPPAPPIFATPASATFSGPGNLAPVPSIKPKTAAQIRAKQLAKALRTCRAKKSRHRRAACEALARRRYASPHRAGASKTAGARTGKRDARP
jgi:hypothetical protein